MTDTSNDHSQQSAAEQDFVIADNFVVAFHYRLYEVDAQGEKLGLLEESTGRQPLLYLHGHNNLLPGLEQVLAGKKAGDEVKVTLSPELAYGPRRKLEVHRIPRKHLPKAIQNKVVPGQIVTLQTDKGARNVVVHKVGKFNVDVDPNHPYAGRILRYELQVASVREATPEEVAHRHAHGPNGHHH